VTLIDCYVSGKRVGISEFSTAAGVWYGSYTNLSGYDMAIPSLLDAMVDSSVKFLEANKEVTSLEYLINLSNFGELHRGVEGEFIRAANQDKTLVGDFITRKERIKNILDTFFSRVETYMTWKRECRKRGYSLEPAVGEVKFRRDEASQGTLFSPTCGVIVTRSKN
jgi:hypothetical protein